MRATAIEPALRLVVFNESVPRVRLIAHPPKRRQEALFKQMAELNEEQFRYIERFVELVEAARKKEQAGVQ